MRIVTAVASTIFLAVASFAPTSPAMAQDSFQVVLDGDQCVPPVATEAFGSGQFTLDAAGIVYFHLEYAALVGAEVEAHLHGPAEEGEVGAVIHTFEAGESKDGFFQLTTEQQGWLRAGLCYVDVHTTYEADGEIRGQVEAASVSTDRMSFGEVKAPHSSDQ